MTGYYVRARVKGEWVTLDIDDPELPMDQLLSFLANKDPLYLQQLILGLLNR